MSEKRKSIKSDLKRIDAMTDADIDYSDIPPTDEAFWADAKVMVPPAKTPLSVRFDSDVVEWFRKQGVGYQTRMNAVLRAYMEVRKRRDSRH